MECDFCGNRVLRRDCVETEGKRDRDKQVCCINCLSIQELRSRVEPQAFSIASDDSDDGFDYEETPSEMDFW